MKLSKTQIEVLSLMQDGWELLVTHAGPRSARLHRLGWETEKVSFATIHELHKRNLIKPIHFLTSSKWILTKLGEEARNA